MEPKLETGRRWRDSTLGPTQVFENTPNRVPAGARIPLALGRLLSHEWSCQKEPHADPVQQDSPASAASWVPAVAGPMPATCGCGCCRRRHWALSQRLRFPSPSRPRIRPACCWIVNFLGSRTPSPRDRPPEGVSAQPLDGCLVESNSGGGHRRWCRNPINLWQRRSARYSSPRLSIACGRQNRFCPAMPTSRPSRFAMRLDSVTYFQPFETEKQ
jgi:hypothetical protein